MKDKKQFAKDINSEGNEEFALNMGNYKLLLIGILIIVVGFIMMMGGGSEDPNVFNEEIFSERRITWAPLTVIGGFIFIIYAIMKD